MLLRPVHNRRHCWREMSKLSDRVKNPNVQNNVWVEFVGLAMKHNAVNLGQGRLDVIFSQLIIINLLMFIINYYYYY